MRIDRIVARAFGPFQGEILELAPGMNVVAGPNESGKSTWHAALRLAISGVRRGKGPGTTAERLIAERHRPWDQSDRWEVEARLALDDGRTIDISQDLGGKVACRAIDVALGRDVSDEILDGTPDASRWLGLDRDAFAATVSVSQAQILAVADAAEELQDQIQRAAATRGTDATAAEAIARLEAFRKDAVGADTVAAKGPLRSAKTRSQGTDAALAEARRLHADYLERGARLEEAERRAADAHLRLAGAEAARARHAAAEIAARVSRAARLVGRYPHPPASMAARDAQADRVAAALESWMNRPSTDPQAGRTAAAIEAEIDSLPGQPSGDTQPHPTVSEAATALTVANDAARLLGERPSAPDPVVVGWQPPQLRELAGRLRTRQLTQAAALEAELERLRASNGSPDRRSLALWALAAGAIASAAAGYMFGAGWLTAGAALAAVALAAGAWRLGRGGASVNARIAHVEAALAPYRLASAEALRDREDAERTVCQAGLPLDPEELDELADRAISAGQVAAAIDEWNRRQAALQARQAAAKAALRSAIRARGEVVPDDQAVDDALSAYLRRCEERAAQRAAAARADVLRVELQARIAAEQAAAAAVARVESIGRSLRNEATQLGLATEDDDPDRLARALESWQRHRSEELLANQQAQAEWQQLQTLLDGRSLAELEAEAARRRQRANELAASLPAAAIALSETGDPEAALAVLRAEDERLRREVDLAAGALAERKEVLPDVPEAEEAAAAAGAELARVEALARDIDTTLQLLRTAEERVHRDLAPVLGQAVGRWLPAVSGGRYAEVSVDPSDLSVKVKEASTGHWRQARLLSEGTREQIYLLLRVAMAQHLVTTDERAPLLLDEVTAQCDADRKRDLLEVLHQLSGERQVILFTHDDEVVAWAQSALHVPDDRLVTLAAPQSRVAVPVAPAHEAGAPPLPVPEVATID